MVPCDKTFDQRAHAPPSNSNIKVQVEHYLVLIQNVIKYRTFYIVSLLLYSSVIVSECDFLYHLSYFVNVLGLQVGPIGALKIWALAKDGLAQQFEIFGGKIIGQWLLVSWTILGGERKHGASQVTQNQKM